MAADYDAALQSLWSRADARLAEVTCDEDMFNALDELEGISEQADLILAQWAESEVHS